MLQKAGERLCFRWKKLRNALKHRRENPAIDHRKSIQDDALLEMGELKKTEQDLDADRLFHLGIEQALLYDRYQESWDYKLTRREQDVAAMICLGYTKAEIARRYNLSPETVKSHTRKALLKMGFKTQEEMRIRLAGWDFSAWEAYTPHRF